MKCPKYITVSKMHSKDGEGGVLKNLYVTISVKKWGLPILLFKALRNAKDLPWYRWLKYPKLCFRVLRGGAGDNL